MELQFVNSPCRCLKKVLGEVRSLEQAQEIRLTDGMPDIGRVLCGWGQVLQRSKEWNGDSISLTAGMMVWVLYAPEDGTAPRWVEGWIPFSMSWDLPEAMPEGSLRIRCITRFVDARSVSARKLMVRAGISAMAEAFSPCEAQVYEPEGEIKEVELKKVRYPLLMPVEAGEKTFTMEEELTLPGNLPPMEKLIYYTLEPEAQEQRVMTDKVVFKGTARIHVLYEGQDEKLHSWDFSEGFSQFEDLQSSCSQEAEAEICCALTSLELEQMGQSVLKLRCAIAGQYLIEDRKVLEITEDAYAPGRELQTELKTLELSRTLENRKELISAEGSLPPDGDLSVDVTFLPDFPRQRYLEGKVALELSGTFQALCYGQDGSLQSAVSRWEGEHMLPADPGVQVNALPLSPSEPQTIMGGGERKVRAEFSLQMKTSTAEGMPMVAALELGEAQPRDENRPSVILRRAGEKDLWEIAKMSGSTMAAIRAANRLEEDPVPGQMLLIPIL